MGPNSSAPRRKRLSLTGPQRLNVSVADLAYSSSLVPPLVRYKLSPSPGCSLPQPSDPQSPRRNFPASEEKEPLPILSRYASFRPLSCGFPIHVRICLIRVWFGVSRQATPSTSRVLQSVVDLRVACRSAGCGEVIWCRSVLARLYLLSSSRYMAWLCRFVRSPY